MAAREYVALTTVNPQFGWTMLYRSSDRDDAEAHALDEIDRRNGSGPSIWKDVEQRNLVVLPLGKARKVAGRCALGECDHDHGDNENY